jgi:CubicO group peptidase (beta-lactamase class C family)
MAGQLVQDISGIPLPEYMRERVFDLLGMTRSAYQRSDRVAGDVATEHCARRGQLRPVRDYDRSLLGPGAVRSTLSDMATYAKALLRTGAGQEGPILRQETLQEMWSPQFSPDPRIPGMGLAFFLHDFDCHPIASHDGNLPGFASSLLLAPEDQVGVVVLTNTATLFGAHLLAGQSFARSLVCGP